jgi:hypothetical protein
MMRTLTAVGATLGVLLAAPLASAQANAGGTFGQQGQFIVSADRLFDLFAFSRNQQDLFNPNPGDNKTTQTSTQTSFGLLWGSAFPTGSENFYTIPRVGFDYTIVDHITVGGEVVAFFTVGGSTSTEHDHPNGSTTTDSADNPGWSVFGIAPRGGYILPLTDLFSLWLRGGFSWYTANSKSTISAGNASTTTSTGIQQFAIDLDPQLVITPLPHAGFTVGLTGDIPIGGGHSQEINITNGTMNANTKFSAASSQAFFGVTTGMLVWF